MDRLDLSRIKNLSLSMPSMKNLKLMSWITREGTEEEAMSSPRDLQDFLAEAQLEHYLSGLRNELKITCVDHLKYVKEEDLEAIGMAKPEMRRLKKFYKRECPQGTFGKLKKAIMRGSDGPGRSLSPSPPEHRISRPTSVIRPPGKQIIPQESIAVNKTLGEGEFGVVQQGVWTTEDGDKVQVAIKCLSKDRLQNGTQEFLKEASVQQSIDNENIVRLYGVVINKDNALMLVTELAPMRSLLECLKETSLRLDFPIPRLCDFAQQICDGMSYLESKRLIHRDLAARNILVFSKNKVKISDFGLSRALGVGKDYYQSNFSINLKLPIAWCAPECINYLKFTSYSDVWAYAVTLWELFTYGFQPWAGMSGQQDPAKAILEAIDMPNNQRLEKPDLCPVEYYDLMMKCWEHEPEERPTFSQIFLKLPQIRPVQVKAVKDYPQVTLEKDHLYYKSFDVIITIDKKPSNAPSIGLWKGALNNGKSGFFDPTNTVPFIEPKTSPISLPKTNLTRKESSRKSSRKLRVDMISGPQNDLRHTGHIGYDGAVFGDVGFIGEAYDKLPARGKAGDESVRSSMTSIDHRDSPDREGYRGTNGYGHSWMSSESLDSHHGEDRQYQDIDDDGILSDFKIPDLTSSLDLGPSFMDEVLRALDEKEKKLEGCSTEPSPSNGGSKLDDLTLTDFDRSRSVSPGGDGRPPPLPTSPPRVEPRRSDSRSEPKKQAKVKPMSASDEKMMESAIALANEFASQNQMRDSQSPPTSPTTKTEKKRTESESSSDSPNLMSKLKKISIKRSPKQERKRTFSDDMNNKSDLDGELPPEAQEAYNMLVVRGSCKDNDESSDNSRQSSERASPASDAVFSNSSEIHLSQPKPSPIASSVNFRPPLPATEPRPPPPKPTPRPRIDPKKSEIPVPRPRPEVVQRVEPTQINRVEPTPRIGLSMSVDVPDTKTETKAESSLSLSVQRQQSLPESKSREREELKKTIEIVRVDSPRREEKVEVSASSSEDLPSKSDSEREPPKSFFDEDFSEPSPREIMSKLREKRVTRSLDHQRGVSGDGEPAPTRSLREPQGIPGKGPSAPSTPAEEEEVDTNPLRMLRGGAIPIRTGRGAPGRRIAKR
ncbi:activated Cdc42 kinase-like isoform X4 [Haliotis cracherodii]|uniref:activated Cdc42 kinase-like isoform X4 n=1 Tax=Haliotis cracherodii TaxID=6455 RepID=UPI0039E80A3F